MRKLYKFIKPFSIMMLSAIILRGTGAFLELQVPTLIGYLIDEGIMKEDVTKIIQMCVGMFIVATSALGVNMLGNYLSANGSEAITEGIRNAMYRHIQKLKINSIEEFTTASLITRITNDVERIHRTLLMSSRFIVRAPVTIVAGTILSFLIDPYLTIAIFIGMVLLLLVSSVVFKFTRPLYRKVQIGLDKLTDILRENLAGIRSVKSFNKLDFEANRFDEKSREVKKNETSAGQVHAVLSPTIMLISNCIIAAVLIISGYRVQDGALEIGKIVTIINYITNVLQSMTAIPRIFMIFSRASTSAARINEVLDDDSEMVYGDETEFIPGTPALEFDSVSFSYPGAKQQSLSDISFKVSSGETLAVIGGTGSGKTTLLHMILRLYDPDKGSVKMYGRDLREYTHGTLKENITAAMQHYSIFSMSIRNNIALGKPVDMEMINKATQSAQLKHLIDRLPDGYDHQVSQNGTNLSGGQKQRVSVSRTLYRDTGIIVLDDVSAALDYKTDLRMRTALKKNYPGKTVVLISQRIASVQHADSIAVLDGGRLVGFGKHEQLLRGNEVYRHICRTQNIEHELLDYDIRHENMPHAGLPKEVGAI